MNEKQLQAAMDDMLNWLSDPHEPGKRPYRIEPAGEFDLHGMHYYIFKYKPRRLSGWYTGVSGGYENDDPQPCGHTFSEMRKYRPETAQNDCVEMAERIRAYWMEQAEKYRQAE